MRSMILTMALAVAAAVGGPASAGSDVSVQTLREIGDRFDRAQIEQDRAALETLVADDLVFVGSSGVREDKKAFIEGFVDPAMRFDPIQVTDRVFLPLGPDVGVVGGDVVLRGTANGKPFASRIRFADTFRRIGGKWLAVHIQATRVPVPAG